MSAPERSTVDRLAGRRGWPCVSLYLPTHRARTDSDEDRIRFQNLIKMARRRLVDEGVREPDADGFLSALRDTAADEPFWRSMMPGGVAVFCSEGECESLVVDTPLPEQCVVGDRYYLRPLLVAVGGESHFYALAIGKAGTRLFACDESSIVEVPLENVPTSFADATKYDVEQDDLQGTTIASPASLSATGRATAMFHGHGGEKDVKNAQLEGYLHPIEKAVTRSIGAGSDTPLVLLGVQDQLATYRAMNTYAHLVPEQATGAVDELSTREIHRLALEKVRPTVQAAAAAELDQLEQARGSALVSTDILEIVSGAAAGRVRTLFFDEGVGPFGRFDPVTLEASIVCDAEPRFLRETQTPEESTPSECGWDLVDLAAAETILHAGSVRAYAGENPPLAGVAALMRY